MVASSEQHNAPVMVSNPAKAHARSNHPGAPLNRDDSAEVIKMPDPIIEPITIIVASIGPSARIRLEDDGSFAVLLVINDEARMTNSLQKLRRAVSDFVIQISFVIRHSVFVIFCAARLC